MNTLIWFWQVDCVLSNQKKSSGHASKPENHNLISVSFLYLIGVFLSIQYCSIDISGVPDFLHLQQIQYLNIVNWNKLHTDSHTIDLILQIKLCFHNNHTLTPRELCCSPPKHVSKLDQVYTLSWVMFAFAV